MMDKLERSSFDVFLSHSRADQDFAERLAGDLERTGFRVWLDATHLLPGDSIAEVINSAVRTSRFLVIVMSPDYFESSWATSEWQYGLFREFEDSRTRLIPLLRRDCDIPEVLETKLWLDVREDDLYDAAIARLVRDLRHLSGRLKPGEEEEADSPRAGERITQLGPDELSHLVDTLREAVASFNSGSKEHQPRIAQSPMDLKMCFLVMPFGDEDLNVVYEDFVRPVLTDQLDLQVERGDDTFGSNVIVDDISESIRRARLIVADLTGRNPNVFYEVGIAHALNKEVLLMTQSIEDVPFDLRHRRAVVYEYSPRGCKRLEKDLFANVRAILSQGTPDEGCA